MDHKQRSKQLAMLTAAAKTNERKLKMPGMRKLRRLTNGRSFRRVAIAKSLEQLLDDLERFFLGAANESDDLMAAPDRQPSSEVNGAS